MSQNEDTIVLLDGVSNEQAADLIKNQPSFVNVGAAVPRFTKINTYTSFLVEYALIDTNIVIHFFETPEKPWTNDTYWRTIFPKALNDKGQEIFQAGYPRLQAKITEEMHSWWFQAKSYAHIIDLDNFMVKFFDALDAALDQLKN